MGKFLGIRYIVWGGWSPNRSRVHRVVGDGGWGGKWNHLVYVCRELESGLLLDLVGTLPSWGSIYVYVLFPYQYMYTQRLMSSSRRRMN
jgi:hypothetical protein